MNSITKIYFVQLELVDNVQIAISVNGLID